MESCKVKTGLSAETVRSLFVSWNNSLGFLFGFEGFDSLDLAKKFPNAWAWLQRMLSRPCRSSLEGLPEIEVHAIISW